ncbi:MAG: PKD domain-containing protein, partial [Anaerolineae bacterium]
VLTDTLEGMAYLSDTSGLSHTGSGSGPIAWDIGSVAPGADVQFDLFVAVTASESDPVTNTLQIATSNPYDQGDPGEKIAQWSGEAAPNDTYLNVGKSAWTPNPAPDNDLVFQIDVCNSGTTASSAVIVTDTVHPSMTVGIWWPQGAGWQEVLSNTHQLALTYPSIPSSQCIQAYLRVHLDAAAWPGMFISNTVAIYSASDLDGNNEATWESQVGEPQINLWVHKSWANGQLVPGGQLHYNVQVGNDGNVAVGETIRVTDVLPAYTTFDGLWLQDQESAQVVTPTLTGPDLVTWEISGLDNGYVRQFELVLNVDSDASVGTVLTNTVEINCLPGESCVDNTSTWVEMLHDHGPNLRVRKDGWWEDWGEDTRRASYWVTIENVGDVRVNEIAFIDHYPEEVLLDSPLDADWSRVSDWGVNPAAHVLTATVDWLNPGESTWGSTNVIVPGTGPVTRGLVLTNTAEVVAVDGEPTEDNIDLAILTTGPDLAVQKTLVSGELLPGGLVTYSLAFGNDRLSSEWWWSMQGNAWLTDTLPVGATFVTATLHWCGASEWCTFLPVDDGTHLTWELWPLGAAEWNEIYVTLRVPDAIQAYDLFTNTVEIASDHPISDAEPYLGNNVAEDVAMAALPIFEVGKSYESSRVAGTAVTYTLSVTNTGNGVGTGVVLSDVLPSGLFYRAGNGTFDGTAVRWELASIAAEGGVTSGWFSATLGCALDTVSNDEYRVVASDQGISSSAGAAVGFEVVAPNIELALPSPTGHIVAGDTVYVTATAATDGSPLRYTWDWGDGPVGGGLSASHVYSLDGTYTVVLTATDGCDYGAAVNTTIDVAAPDLVPSFDYAPVPAQVMIEWPVIFTDTTTTDGPAIVAWHWDFGDGSSGTGAQVSHAYLEAGTFTVTLTVTDALGYSAQHAAPGLVTVSDCVPLSSVSLAYAPLDPLVGMPMILTATVAPPEATGPITYEWDLGDGTTQATAAASIVHTYTADGPMEVRVAATNRCTPAGVSDQQDIVIGLRRIYLPIVMRNR